MRRGPHRSRAHARARSARAATRGESAKMENYLFSQITKKQKRFLPRITRIDTDKANQIQAFESVFIRVIRGQILFLRGAAQFVGERVEAGGLRFDQPELVHELAELVDDAAAPGAVGRIDIAEQQAAQMLPVVLHAF